MLLRFFFNTLYILLMIYVQTRMVTETEITEISVIMTTVATETQIIETETTEVSVIMITVVTETGITEASVIMITVQTRMVTEIITVRVDFQIRAEEMTEEIRHLRMISFLRQSLIQEDLIQEKIIIKMTARKMWKLKKILNLQTAS